MKAKLRLLGVLTILTTLAIALTMSSALVKAQEGTAPVTPTNGKWQLDAADAEVVNMNEPAIYIIQLADAPLASYRGGVQGLAATNPSAAGTTRLTNTAATAAYLDYLAGVQAAFLSNVNQSLGRNVDVKFTYRHAFNGVAISVTPLEAQKLAQMDGVAMVTRETIEEVATDVGPEWIGATDIWGGTTTAYPFMADLDGGQEVPPTASTNTGTGTFSYNFGTNELEYDITIDNADGASFTAAHIHVGAAGANGGVIVNFGLVPTNAATFNISGTVVIPDVNEGALVDEGLYVNFHSAANPGGDIRGQIMPTTPGNFGEGVVVAILDTGVNSTHPSFAAVGGDGYVHTNPLTYYLGVCDPNNPDYQPSFVCNDKLIGVHDFIDGDGNDPDSPEDGDGHGSHTGSTVAGNIVEAALFAPTAAITQTISGVAPHANIIAYDVCRNGEAAQGGGCPGSSTLAAINQVVADSMILPNGVAAINYSISGGGNPYGDPGELAFLAATDAGVFVSASAGNAGPGAGTVAHVSPWVATIAASTHNRNLTNNVVSLTSDGPTLADIDGVGFTAGYGPAPILYAGNFGDALCLNPFAPGTFSGQIVICDRGTNARVDKGANVLAGGAGGMILADNGAGVVSDAHFLPATHINQADGVTLKAWVAANTNPMGEIAGTAVDLSPANGDIMAGFSSRGPVGAFGVLKPDVTAPGVSIWAAVNNDGSGPDDYGFLSGTSMSSPHNAGAAALMAALYPSWTPHQIKSALMLTADNVDNYKEDGVTPADPFDLGAGRIQVNVASNAGFVLNETTQNFEDADPALNGGQETALQQLNVASLANANCVGSCSWTRTIESVLSASADYTVTATSPAGITITVTPANFTLAAGGTQELTIEADVSGAAITGDWEFASVQFEGAAEGEITAVEVLSYTGTTVGSSDTWARPFTVGDGSSGSCSISGTGNNVPYVTQLFTVTMTADYRIDSAQNYDGYIHVYENSFNPADACVNLIALDDDGGPGSQIETVPLSAGVDYYLVTSGFGNSDTGDFTNTVFGLLQGPPSMLPDAAMPVALIAAAGNIPSRIDVETRRDADSYTLNDLEAVAITDSQVTMYGPAQADLYTTQLLVDPTNGLPYDNLAQVYWTTVEVPAGAKRLVAEILASTSLDIDLYWGTGDTPSAATEVGNSATGAVLEYLSASDPAPGTYWVLVQNWQSSGAGVADDVALAIGIVPDTDSGLAMFDMPASVPAGEPFSATLYWDFPGSVLWDQFYGVMELGADAGNPTNLGTVDIDITRVTDDVTKEASTATAEPGDTVTYTITVAANTGAQPLTYVLTDTVPAGMTIVPGSATGGATITGNTVTWTGTQSPPGADYVVSTSLTDASCTMPLANSGRYVNLEAFGFFANAAITGNGLWQDTSYGGGAYAFYDDNSGANTGSNLYFDGSGYVTLDLASLLGGPYTTNSDLPAAGLPNALLAMIWNPDVEIVYEAGTGPTNRGVTTGIQLTTGGIPSAKLLEFDDVQLAGDPASRADFEMLIREAIDDTPGVYEIVFAYDNLTGDFATGLAQGTIGVENFAGNRGTTYAYDDANLATLANGMAVCFNWQIPDGIGDYVITYQATVDAGVANGTVLTNVVEHDNDHAGTAVETSEASVTIALPATYGVELDAPTAAITGTIGTTVTYSINITNTGSTTDTFDIAVTGNGWTTTAPADITLGAGEMGSFDVTVAISGTAVAGDQDVATVAATSQMDVMATASVDLTTTAEEMPATSYGIYLPLILKP